MICKSMRQIRFSSEYALALDNTGKDSLDLVLSRTLETQSARSEEEAFLEALAYSLV